MKDIVLQETIEKTIFIIRGIKVMLDRDLAKLYGVPTKRLNEQVKRNIARFPIDFMFQLTDSEKDELVANCDHLKSLKFSSSPPYAFTEQGIAMLSSVLNSERAIRVNIAIMRIYVKLREMLLTHKELGHRLNELERKSDKHDGEIRSIFQAIYELMAPHPKPPRRKIVID